MTGKTYETGIKGELFGGAVNTSIALYYTKREDQSVQDANYPATQVLFGGNCCYLNGGETISKGIDMEISGELLRDWMLMASYTLNLNKNRDTGSALSTVTPKHVAKLFTTYRLKRLTLGAGVRWQSSTQSAWIPMDYQQRKQDWVMKQDAYYLVDLMARYQIDQRFALQLNVNNVFNKKYYTGQFRGMEREVMLNMNLYW